jgi:uncharacterized protein YbjT (DUF2867 family)
VRPPGGIVIVVTGATGNTGRVVAEKLLASGEKVRVVGRLAAKLTPLAAKGAEPCVADMTDPVGANRALAGAEAAYLVIPPNLKAENVRAYQEAVSDAMLAAVRQNGVRRVVMLSSIGADKADRTGPIAGLHFLEQKLTRIADMNAIFLRAAYFMENLLVYAGVIKTMGMTAGALNSDLPIPMIATQDIAAVAADALRARNFSGCAARELLGPRDYSMKEATSILGASIGKPGLKYQHLPGMMIKPALRQMGLSADMADSILELDEGLNSGHIRALEPRSAQNTPPTTLEQFAAEVFAPAFNAS